MGDFPAGEEPRLLRGKGMIGAVVLKYGGEEFLFKEEQGVVSIVNLLEDPAEQFTGNDGSESVRVLDVRSLVLDFAEQSSC